MTPANWCVYCLVSVPDTHTLPSPGPHKQTYVGISTTPYSRLLEHNAGKCYSTRGRVWAIAGVLIGLTREQATRLERYLKRGDTVHKRQCFCCMLPWPSDGEHNRRLYWNRLPTHIRRGLDPLPPWAEVLTYRCLFPTISRYYNKTLAEA